MEPSLECKVSKFILENEIIIAFLMHFDDI